MVVVRFGRSQPWSSKPAGVNRRQHNGFNRHMPTQRASTGASSAGPPTLCTPASASTAT